jgi:hypothetical protein
MDGLSALGGFLLVVIVAAFIASFVYLLDSEANDTARLHHARNHASQICGPLGAITYDVQDQDELVYACNSDHILRTMGY